MRRGPVSHDIRAVAGFAPTLRHYHLEGAHLKGAAVEDPQFDAYDVEVLSAWREWGREGHPWPRGG